MMLKRLISYFDEPIPDLTINGEAVDLGSQKLEAYAKAEAELMGTIGDWDLDHIGCGCYTVCDCDSYETYLWLEGKI